MITMRWNDRRHPWGDGDPSLRRSQLIAVIQQDAAKRRAGARALTQENRVTDLVQLGRDGPVLGKREVPRGCAQRPLPRTDMLHDTGLLIVGLFNQETVVFDPRRLRRERCRARAEHRRGHNTHQTLLDQPLRGLVLGRQRRRRRLVLARRVADVAQPAFEFAESLPQRRAHFGNALRAEEEQEDRSENEPMRNAEFTHRASSERTPLTRASRILIEYTQIHAPGRIRTSDQQLRRLLLYPPELRAPRALGNLVTGLRLQQQPRVGVRSARPYPSDGAPPAAHAH